MNDPTEVQLGPCAVVYQKCERSAHVGFTTTSARFSAFSLSFGGDFQAIAVAFRLPVNPIYHSGLNRRARHPVVLRLLRFLCGSESANFFDPLNSDVAVAVYT
jgi:hypothetical protein